MGCSLSLIFLELTVSTTNIKCNLLWAGYMCDVWFCGRLSEVGVTVYSSVLVSGSSAGAAVFVGSVEESPVTQWVTQHRLHQMIWWRERERICKKRNVRHQNTHTNHLVLSNGKKFPLTDIHKFWGKLRWCRLQALVYSKTGRLRGRGYYSRFPVTYSEIWHIDTNCFISKISNTVSFLKLSFLITQYTELCKHIL